MDRSLRILGPLLLAVSTPAIAEDASGKRVFAAADFARYSPRNALDMLRQVPGFTIRQAEEERGLGQASENVLLNGQRIASKSGGAVAELERISAANVERIEIADAATLNIAGLTGQVANIIVKAEKKSSGQFSWTPEFRPHFTDPIFTRGSISYSGKTGKVDYTVGLNSGGNRSGAGGGGGTQISDASGHVFEFRDDEWKDNYNYPKLTARLGIDGKANLNLSAMPYFEDYFEHGVRVRPEGVDSERSIHDRTRGLQYEVGGDYSFKLGSGQLKLIGLRKFDTDLDPKSSTAITTFADGSQTSGDRFEQVGTTSEWIGRGEYSWKIGRSDFQLSAEGAFNSLDSKTRIFELSPSGEFDEVPFPGGSGRVHEDRYEVLGTWGRPLAKDLEMQLVAGAEYSKLSSSSDIASQTRSFFRPKGSLSLAWKASSTLDVSLKLARKVGQLNFYDFLASVNFSDDHNNAGNLNLVPPQSWEADLELAKKWGAWGSSTVKLYARRIDDIVDIVPIGDDGESVGNLDRAKRYGVEWTNTLLLDKLGWHGAKVDSSITLQKSSVKDPLTGETRPISDDVKRVVDITLRHDIPKSDWAWGANMQYAWFAKTYRLTEVGRQWEGPIWLKVFVENKDVAGLTIRATAGNLLNARSRWDRTVYDGFRTVAPIRFREHRNRLIGPIFSLSVKGNF